MILFQCFICQVARYLRGGVVSDIWRMAQLKAKAQLKVDLCGSSIGCARLSCVSRGMPNKTVPSHVQRFRVTVAIKTARRRRAARSTRWLWETQRVYSKHSHANHRNQIVSTVALWHSRALRFLIRETRCHPSLSFFSTSDRHVSRHLWLALIRRSFTINSGWYYTTIIPLNRSGCGSNSEFTPDPAEICRDYLDTDTDNITYLLEKTSQGPRDKELTGLFSSNE
jgi:hypothetical protein